MYWYKVNKNHLCGAVVDELRGAPDRGHGTTRAHRFVAPSKIKDGEEPNRKLYIGRNQTKETCAKQQY